VADEAGLIIAGHGRHAAAQLLGLAQVPVIAVAGLSETKRRALSLADNKIAANAGWDRELLAQELPELAELLVVEGLELSITGFAPVEISSRPTLVRRLLTPPIISKRAGAPPLSRAGLTICGSWAITGSCVATRARSVGSIV
jgi:ParB-like chromosome segregation protein Spo0J